MELTYTIEATGLGGWMSYRYQYNIGAIDRFGYAETREEAEEAIKGMKVYEEGGLLHRKMLGLD